MSAAFLSISGVGIFRGMGNAQMKAEFSASLIVDHYFPEGSGTCSFKEQKEFNSHVSKDTANPLSHQDVASS